MPDLITEWPQASGFRVAMAWKPKNSEAMREALVKFLTATSELREDMVIELLRDLPLNA